MSKLSRRQILVFFAGSAGAAVLGDTIINSVSKIAGANKRPLSFTPVRLPHPLPIYKQQKSFLPTGIGDWLGFTFY
jgi:hypothetical protein